MNGDKGICPPQRVRVKDTTGAGDAFCAGVASGLTYGKDDLANLSRLEAALPLP